MTKHVLLNNVDHKDLKVDTSYSAEFGNNVASVITFPTEYADIQREYPILFRKDEKTGEFQSVALLGLKKDENLFLDENGWNASYIPGIVAREPFLIGFQSREVDGELRKEPVIHIDIESPRVNEKKGQPLFLEHGGNSPYLERIATTLQAIHEGLAVAPKMFAAFEEFDLIEPVNIEVDANESEKYRLSGFYTISQEKLSALDGAALEKLNKAGFLQGAFLVMASLGNISKLIDIKNRKRVQGDNASVSA